MVHGYFLLLFFLLSLLINVKGDEKLEKEVGAFLLCNVHSQVNIHLLKDSSPELQTFTYSLWSHLVHDRNIPTTTFKKNQELTNK